MTSNAFHHILVPTDGSEGSIHAAQLAFRLLRGSSGRVTLLFVVDRALLTELRRFGEGSDTAVHEELRDHGQRYLELLEQEATSQGIPVATALREGNPFEEIVAYAREIGADLIAMGHVGQRGTTRALLGSVTQRVLDFAPCPVLVVKRDGM